MNDLIQVYFQKTHLDSIIEVNDIVVMRYYEFQNDISFNELEVHNFWEFVYVDKGQIQVIADDNCFTLKQGEMVFHKPGQAHDLYGDGKVAPNVLVGCFFCSDIAMEYFEDKIVTINKRNKELLSEIVYETQQAFEKQNDDVYLLQMVKKRQSMVGSQQMLKLHLEELLIRLIREDNFERKKERSQSVTRDNFESEMVEKIVTYMRNNIRRNLKREDVCKEFSICATSLENMFKKIKNQSAMKYFSDLKVDVAKKLIRENTYNFTQIAEILGYNTQHYFSAVFKKSVNMTPSEYAISIKALKGVED